MQIDFIEKIKARRPACLQPFTAAAPVHIPLARAEREIRPGWVAQFRGRSYISRLIAAATGGVHSHSAMLAPGPHGTDVLEVREMIGGRTIRLADYVAQGEVIDLFRIDLNRWPEYDGEAAVARARCFVARTNYNYAQVLRLMLRKIPLVWRLYANSTDDEATIGNVAAHCSHAVADWCRTGGGVDPVPRLPDHFVDPAHITRSLLFDYYGTIQA